MSPGIQVKLTKASPVLRLKGIFDFMFEIQKTCRFVFNARPTTGSPSVLHDRNRSMTDDSVELNLI